MKHKFTHFMTTFKIRSLLLFLNFFASPKKSYKRLFYDTFGAKSIQNRFIFRKDIFVFCTHSSTKQNRWYKPEVVYRISITSQNKLQSSCVLDSAGFKILQIFLQSLNLRYTMPLFILPFTTKPTSYFGLKSHEALVPALRFSHSYICEK